MTTSTSPPPDAGPPPRPSARLIALSAARVIAATGVLLALYYLLPLSRDATWTAITTLCIGLLVLIGLVIVQVRSILVSPFAGIRAVEALASSVPLFLLLFAGTYFTLERLAPGTFSEPLTRSDSLYFTVTVFSTVGFGDITPKTELARLLVTGQMITDVVILGIAVKIIVGTARSRRSHSRQAGLGARVVSRPRAAVRSGARLVP
jgi:voltage-gated potassium channel